MVLMKVGELVVRCFASWTSGKSSGTGSESESGWEGDDGGIGRGGSSTAARRGGGGGGGGGEGGGGFLEGSERGRGEVDVTDNCGVWEEGTTFSFTVMSKDHSLMNDVPFPSSLVVFVVVFVVLVGRCRLQKIFGRNFSLDRIGIFSHHHLSQRKIN